MMTQIEGKLRYTGHPFVDVGVAVITAFNNKPRPEDIEKSHLYAIADYLKDIYCHLKPVQNFISVIFTNAHFAQPAKTVQEKELYADEVLYAFERDHNTEEGENRCTFFPYLGAIMNAHRQHIPLLNGETISNFSPLGTRGIPVSGLALLAIHAMPLGCYKCGHLLAFHQLSTPGQSDSGRMNLVLAKRALEANRTAISMMSPVSSEGEIPSFGSHKRTRYVDMLLRATRDSLSRHANINNITGYYFTNYGPKPSLEILRLDNAVLDFVNIVQQDAFAAWNRVVYLCWQPSKGATENEEPDTQNTQTWRNRIYEYLFQLPGKARVFISELAQGHDWHLIEVFLERVIGMEKERIEVYRELGDRLARYILEYENGSPGFYYEFRRARDYTKLRSRIFSAAERMRKAQANEPLFTYDEFITAFEHPSDTYSRWKLARDLIAIRILEVLHNNQVDLSTLPDIPEDESDE